MAFPFRRVLTLQGCRRGGHKIPFLVVCYVTVLFAVVAIISSSRPYTAAASGDQNDRLRVEDQKLTLVSDTQQTLLHGIMSRIMSFFTVRNQSSDMRDKGIGLRTDDSKELESPVKVPDAFLIEEADFCRRRPRLQVIAYVHSAISRVQERQETRSTWANATASGLGVDIAAVFMVGRAKDERERQIVQEESQRYHDIVQHHCPQVPWTLHADDDVFIDVFLMKDILQDFRAEITEAFLCNSEWSRTQRSGRWAVSHDDFRNDEYPVFCSGAAWVLPTRLLSRLLRASQTAPFLWVDDVYITGILARHAGVTHLGTGYKAKHIQPSDVGDVMFSNIVKPLMAVKVSIQSLIFNFAQCNTIIYLDAVIWEVAVTEKRLIFMIYI
ncbi:beta-1,3-galactosyltransferase 5-like [Penaeus indicus]|uniref:beta-1,3-galactosyltransferase 5-like n=1 Tax=Penaeus indicus TaxID=29960 RepID=UPI00300D5294